MSDYADFQDGFEYRQAEEETYFNAKAHIKVLGFTKIRPGLNWDFEVEGVDKLLTSRGVLSFKTLEDFQEWCVKNATPEKKVNIEWDKIHSMLKPLDNHSGIFSGFKPRVDLEVMREDVCLTLPISTTERQDFYIDVNSSMEKLKNFEQLVVNCLK